MKFLASTLATALLIAPVSNAAGAASLAPGTPAGVHRAQEYDDNTLLFVALGAAVVAGIVIAASGDDDSKPVQAPTTTAATGTV